MSEFAERLPLPYRGVVVDDALLEFGKVAASHQITLNKQLQLQLLRPEEARSIRDQGYRQGLAEELEGWAATVPPSTLTLPATEIHIFWSSRSASHLSLALRASPEVRDERGKVVELIHKYSEGKKLPEVFNKYRYQVLLGKLVGGESLDIDELNKKLRAAQPDHVTLEHLDSVV